MRRSIGICFFVLFMISVCFAQSQQAETVTITTYYPSPTGVYSTIRLYPSNQTSAYARDGSIYYNSTDSKLYLYNGTAWAPIGASAGANKIVKSGGAVYPDTCDGTIFTIFNPEHQASVNYELCSGLWYKTVTFSPAFTSNASKPSVFVSAQRASGRNSTSITGTDPVNDTCSLHGTRTITAYAANITNTSFRLYVSGGVEWNFASDPYDCELLCAGNSTAINKIRTYYTKGEAQWMAIGE